MNDQITSWRMIKVFYNAFNFFRKLENNFKENVRKPIANAMNKKSILYETFIEHLEPTELEDLRDTYLVELRNLSHTEFRSRKKMERFDIYISEIFHEVSILKEQKFILDHYFQRKDLISQSAIQQMLRQTFELFETKMDHIAFLFKNAKVRLEEILPIYRNDDFILRNLYLEGPRLLKNFYQDPIKETLNFMFIEGGFSSGMIAIASSFSLGGFFEQGKKVIMALKKDDLKRLSPELLNMYKKIKLFLKEHQDKDKLETSYQIFLMSIKSDLYNLKLN